MNRLELKQLLKKSDMVRYMWENNNPVHNLWNCDFLCDEIDRGVIEDHYFSNYYNQEVGVFLYKLVRNKFKLIAIIRKDGVRIL